MNLKVETTIFSSKISKRIFTTFVACALLPIVCFAIVVYFQVTSYLQNYTINGLRGSVKSLALSIDDQLKVLENELEFISLTMNDHNPVKSTFFTDTLDVIAEIIMSLLSISSMFEPSVITFAPSSSRAF